MKVGVNFFVTAETISAAPLARAVEEAGFDSLWVPDHIVMPTARSSYFRTGGSAPRVYEEMADPFVCLAFAAAATTSLKLATGICVVAQRHPLSLAKTIGTLDRLSDGRVIFGVGGGWLAEEIELFGVRFGDRWTYARESVEAMRKLWADGSASYSGRLVSFPEVICRPTPVQRPGPPVVVGGPATDATFRRVARWADGWAPVFTAPDGVAEGTRAIAHECEAIGRDPAEIETSVFVKDPSPAMQDAYAAAGATRLIVQLYNHPGTPMPFDEWQSHHVLSGSERAPTADETLTALDRVEKLAAL